MSQLDHRPTVEAQVWLVDLTHTAHTVAAETMPQAVGGLATFAGARLDLSSPVRIFKYPAPLARALVESGPPDVIGFSNYIWNSNLSLAFAAGVKRLRPETTVVLGGPHYPIFPEDQEAFLTRVLGSDVDFYVDREGEEAFTDLLLALSGSGFDHAPIHGEIAGVHSVDEDGRAHVPAPRKRLHTLRDIPSPYLTGLMDEFFDGRLLPTVQTNRGCPFSCTFCVEGSHYFSKVAKKDNARIREELHYIGGRMAALLARGETVNELLITDSNFGMYPDDLATCEAIAECQEAYGWPRYVNVTTGKNKRERVLLAADLVNGAIRLSGAVQSLDPDVLLQIKRSNIDADQLLDVALAARNQGTESFSEIILGLPHDSKERHYKTLEKLIDGGMESLNMYQLSLLPGSELCTDRSRAQYGMTTRFRVVPRCFGTYDVGGTTVDVIEVDEVCVSLPELSYDDYLECRRMHLIVQGAYNGAPLAALTTLLRARGQSVFHWLRRMMEAPKGPRLTEIMDSFEEATNAQLWEDGDALARTPLDEATRVPSFGDNLLYTYRARVLTEGFEDLAECGAAVCRAVLREAGSLDASTDEFVAEAAEYHRLRLADVLGARPGSLRQEARFDVDAFVRDGGGDLERYRLATPCVREFTLSNDQVRMGETYLRKLGNTPAGVGRLLSRVHLSDVFRKAEVREPAGAAPGPRAEAARGEA